MYLWWRYKPGDDDGRVDITERSLYLRHRGRVMYYLKEMAVVSVLIWLLLSVFYGAMHKRTFNGDHIRLELINLDNGPVGSALMEMLMQAPVIEHAPVWTIYSKAKTLDEAKEHIRKDGWGALVINSGVSEHLRAALHRDAEYDPSEALVAIRSTGRHPTGESLFVASALSSTANYLAQEFSCRFIRAFQRGSRTSHNHFKDTNIQAIIAPIKHSKVDVGPMNFPCAIVMPHFIFLVLLLCTLSAVLEWKTSSFPIFCKVQYRDQVLLWVAVAVSWAGVLSVYAPLSFLAYRGPTYSTNNEGSPVTARMLFVIWAIAWITTLACELWMVIGAFLLPPMYIPLVFITSVFYNVSSAIVPIELAPSFFRWFYALPFFNGAMLFRYIVSGAYPRLRQYLPVMIGEVCVSIVGLAAAVFIRQRWVLNGTSDSAGWFHGCLFFQSPIPHYDDADEQELCDAETLAGLSYSSESLHRGYSCGSSESLPEIVDEHNHDNQVDMRRAMFGV